MKRAKEMEIETDGNVNKGQIEKGEGVVVVGVKEPTETRMKQTPSQDSQTRA